MILVGCVILTSTPALAAQAMRSVKRTCPKGVAIAFALGFYKVTEDAPAELPDVDLAMHFGRVGEGALEEPFSFSGFNNEVARALMDQHSGRGRDIDCQLDYLLFLNDDVMAPDGSNWLTSMIRAHKEARASEVGLKLIYPEGRVAPGKIQHCGHYRGHSGTGAHRGLYADKDAPQFSCPDWVETWAVTGACVLVTPADFELVGGFDVGYRTLWQDVDLSLALRQATDRPVVCVQDEWIYHFEGATQGGRFDEEPWWIMRPDVQQDRDRFLEKWPPWKDGERCE